ncbi:hypothetical protein PIB30_029759 [Stylosanthes scabra]|uniref:Uncharacterized protein n=1 Tax=Stylosanthes scabra TaxID=79078 RepID=A0ABU6QCQ3_9FABA|nr:hypothetical protein [Stylosanthes scabra]
MDPSTTSGDDYIVPNWTTGDLAKMRRRFLLNIVLNPWNACLGEVEDVAHAPQRNVPPRNKKKEIKSP